MLGQPKINKVQAPATYEMLRLKIVREQPLLRFSIIIFIALPLCKITLSSSFIFYRIYTNFETCWIEIGSIQ